MRTSRTSGKPVHSFRVHVAASSPVGFMISGQDLLLGKRAVQLGLLTPTMLNDALALQQVSPTYRSLTEVLEERELLDTEKIQRLRELRGTVQRTESQSSVRLADYLDLLFGTTAVVHGFCGEQELTRALEVLDQADPDMPVALGHVMVALNMLKPEDVGKIRGLQNSDVGYCPACDTIQSPTRSADGTRGADLPHDSSATCSDCKTPLVRDQMQVMMPSERMPRVAGKSSQSEPIAPLQRPVSGEVATFSDDAFTVPLALVDVRDAEIVEEGTEDALPVSAAEADDSVERAGESPAGKDDPHGGTPRPSTTTLPTSAQHLGERDLEDAVRAAGQSEYLRRVTRRHFLGEANAAPRDGDGDSSAAASSTSDAIAVSLHPRFDEGNEPAVAGPFDDYGNLHRYTPAKRDGQREASERGGSDPIHWRRPTGSPSESTLRVVELDDYQTATSLDDPEHRSAGTRARRNVRRRDEEDSTAGAGAGIGVQLGEYVVLSELGRGGMGVVYLARKVDEARPRFAIKFIRKDLSRNATYVRRFEREIKLVLSLNHANIVATHEYGQRNGFWYLVMEYVRGENLGDVLERENRLSVNRAVSVVRQTALALASAHEQGIVHRDMKPDNIILSPVSDVRNVPHAPPGHAEMVKVTDFGLAKEMAGLEDTLTITGQLIGTPHYMSPEQCRGDYSDQRSDIYSLGCAFYHMLTGRPPFLGDNYLSVMEQQKSESITPPHMINPSVPLSLSFIIGKMMEKNANDRYPTMDLLVSHLDMWDSTKLVDEVARYAPAFSRVRSAFGRSEEFSGSAGGGGGGERAEKELRKARDHAEWLRQRLIRLEHRLQRDRNLQVILITGGTLATLLGLAVGYALGSGGIF